MFFVLTDTFASVLKSTMTVAAASIRTLTPAIILSSAYAANKWEPAEVYNKPKSDVRLSSHAKENQWKMKSRKTCPQGSDEYGVCLASATKGKPLKSSRLRVHIGRRRITNELRELIFRMVAENPTWGAPPIHSELQTLGFDVESLSGCALKYRACSDWSR
jgi:hypothetical protein